jgi:hypothetical protein
VVAAAIAAASAVALLGPATASPSGGGLQATGLGSGPLANAAAENLVRYLPSRVCKPKPRRCKIRREIAFLGVCSADCRIGVRMILRVRGRRIRRGATATFDAGEVFRGFLRLNRQAVRVLRQNRTRSRFITRIRAVEVGNPANVDIDRRIFRFVRG